MVKYPLLQVDAFAETPLEGNPCAVVLDADNLSSEMMLAIAREMNLSETAFVRRSSVCDFGVRYYTPAEEIPMAGHPTIATTFALVDTGRLALKGERTSITLELKVGPIPVEILSEQNRVKTIIMTQKKPVFSRIYSASEVLSAFNLRAGDELSAVPIQTVSTGTPQLMIPLKNHDALRRARIDIENYEQLRREGDFFSPHLFCLGGATAEGQTFARHFGVPPDTMEDPFTGSATGGMACYLWRHGLIDSPRFVAEQGHWMRRPGKANVEVVGPREDIHSVRIGGSAVTIFRGELEL